MERDHTTPASSRPGRYGSTRYLWVDVVTMGYMAATGALSLLIGHDQPGWLLAVLLHFAYVAYGLEIVRASQRHPSSVIVRELRTWYPIFIIVYGFFDVARLQGLISQGTFWATDALIDIDLVLFGAHPTIWIERWHTPWLTELVCFFNISYYIIAFVFAVPMVIMGRRREVFAAASIALFTYVVNFTLFLLMPAIGPRMVPSIETLRTATFDGGGPFEWLMRLLQGDNGAVRGGAFPSVHVSASVAWAMAAWRYERRLSWILWPLTLGTAFSTVYLGFHHAIDPLAGLVLGAICYWIGLRIIRARGEDPSARGQA